MEGFLKVRKFLILTGIIAAGVVLLVLGILLLAS